MILYQVKLLSYHHSDIFYFNIRGQQKLPLPIEFVMSLSTLFDKLTQPNNRSTQYLINWYMHTPLLVRYSIIVLNLKAECLNYGLNE
jgi:hypothetical protein